jgi:hypothetical protein
MPDSSPADESMIPFGKVLSVLKVVVPKLRFANAPQKSPPLDRRSWASGLRRPQSGVKLPFASVQDLVTFWTMREDGFPLA